MEEIKVIDLLVLIANRGKLPRKIYLPELYRDEFRNAHLDKFFRYVYDADGMNVVFMNDYLSLNDSITIIEW